MCFNCDLSQFFQMWLIYILMKLLKQGLSGFQIFVSLNKNKATKDWMKQPKTSQWYTLSSIWIKTTSNC